MSKIIDGKGTTLAWGTTTTFIIEKTRIKPPGVAGGGKIEMTHLGNTAFRTAAPKSLKDVSDIEFSGHWDPTMQSIAPINSNEAITITFPGSQQIVVYGFLDEFTPGDAVEGGKVEATGKIIVTNRNASGVETGPAYSS